MKNTRDTQLLFELSRTGCRATRLPECDVPELPLCELLPTTSMASTPPNLPELSEPQVVRHFVNLSTQNMCVDTHFYPLGSCTMKYNPKRNERIAGLPGLADLHPYQSESTLQGMLQILYELQEILQEISGLAVCSLQPAAGAHGELTALLVASAYFRNLGQKRPLVLVPDNAHGTNPASASMAGFQSVTIKTTSDGFVDMDELATKLDDQVAVLMITNPSTLGLFEPHMRQIADQVHAVGGLVYLDGANMNAILGVARPGDFGADMQHFNPHKTFSGPHGGGGPGAGPICVTKELAPFLPVPIIVPCERQKPCDHQEIDEKGSGPAYRLDWDRPKSIGRVRAFFGNVGVLLRTYAYIRTHGPDGLRRVSENAVLNANYLLSRIKQILPIVQDDRCLHEFVATAAQLKAEKNISAMDIAKRLLDYGFHAPTVYFPLTVPEAIMIEPTESESKQTLDDFTDALFCIIEEDPQLLHDAPHTTSISRPDEVQAARQQILSHPEA
jgi:glycine dehydrogenase subunit 2